MRAGLYGLAGWLVGVLSENQRRLSSRLEDRDRELEELRTIQEALAPAEPPQRPALELATCYSRPSTGYPGTSSWSRPARAEAR